MSRCAACGSALDPAARFCPSCGAPAASGSQTPTRFLAGEEKAGAGAARVSPGSSAPSSSGSLDEGRFVPGTVLAGRYRIVGLLGRGGMGEVYRANDLKLGQAVAMKFLPEALSRDADALARLLGEVRIARTVSHPNVCRMYDVGEIDGHHFLSMEYVDGEDLASLLRRIGRLPQDKTIELARQLCAGLAAAHDKGVLHRDLKPANIMIDGRGKVLITDFGLAGLAAQIQQGEVRAGTPAYMAPEQLAGRDVTARSDLYALGLVLYEMVAGKAVFKGASIAEIARRHEESESETARPSDAAPGLDPGLERVILRCLEKDPRRRPVTALAVAAALPGGDPLAAALAAGETPSPEMLAASGGVGAMRPWIAWACLAAVVASIAAVMALPGSQRAVRQLSREHPPQVLTARARDILRRLGHTKPPADIKAGWDNDDEYQGWIRERDASPDRWRHLLEGRPSSLRFWYRQSPQDLVPFAFGGPVPVVDPGDPPAILTDMAKIYLDPKGRLLYLEVVPPQVQDPAPASIPVTDWRPLFEEAGLDSALFRSTEPLWTPPVWSDARASWEGAYPGRPDLPVKIIAASERGRINYFAMIFPWTLPHRMESRPTPAGLRIAQSVFLALALSCVVCGALLARRNLRLGRGDRRGAFRIALIAFVFTVAAWVVGGTHVPSFYELGLFMESAGVALFFGGVSWLLYIALEPSIRRRWPGALISWNRVLTGRLRDPLVGRDVLIGAATGGVIAVMQPLENWIERRLGMAGPAPLPDVFALDGWRSVVSHLMSLVPFNVLWALLLMFLIFGMRVVLRREWLGAAALVTLLSVAIALAQEHPLLALGFVAVYWAGVIVVFTRFGLLAMTVLVVVTEIAASLSPGFDLSGWWVSAFLFRPITILLIAVYGFRTALAGQPVFGDPFSRE